MHCCNKIIISLGVWCCHMMVVNQIEKSCNYNDGHVFVLCCIVEDQRRSRSLSESRSVFSKLYICIVGVITNKVSIHQCSSLHFHEDDLLFVCLFVSVLGFFGISESYPDSC